MAAVEGGGRELRVEAMGRGECQAPKETRDLMEESGDVAKGNKAQCALLYTCPACFYRARQKKGDQMAREACSPASFMVVYKTSSRHIFSHPV